MKSKSNSKEEMKKKATYEAAGVDILAGMKAVELMKERVRGTFRPEVITDIGGFAGLFALRKEKYDQPVLVAATDGVGTKLKIAQMLDKHDTVGIDLVAMCVNDVVVQGAEPLFFLDYLATGVLVPEKAAEIVKGIADGCQQAGCALLGGETAEMPGFYQGQDYDLAGFAVGVVDRDKIIDGTGIIEGDVVLGLASSGLHSNGFSLVRKVLLEDSGFELSDRPLRLESTLGEELLIPTRIYVQSLLSLFSECKVSGLAHITGGGISHNVSRILPDNLDAVLDPNAWKTPPIFSLIQEMGNVEEEEMLRTFNMGIGMVIVLSSAQAPIAEMALEESGEEVFEIGTIERGTDKVRYHG
jgi:phosphoribosylformylglycinamidine cyclo-ligase